jgi:hypothetical protein
MYQKDATAELNLNFKSNVSTDNFNTKIDVESPSYELIYNAASSNSIFKYFFQGATSRFQITPQPKFVSNSFLNNGNDVINFPQNANGETLATVEGIANTTFWNLSSPSLYPKSNFYNVLIGTSTPDASAPKLEVNGDTLLGGDVATTGNLTVRSRYKVEFNSPNTILYDPTSYSTSNPYNQFNINGTLHLLNLPVDSGASSLFKFTKTGSTEIMTLDATGLMTLNGDDVAEINIKNTGNANDVSVLKFSNATNSNLYKFQFMDSVNAFTLFRDGITVFQHNSSTDVFEVNSQLTVADGATSALELSSNTNTGAQSIVNFTTNGTSKYTYVYDNDTGSFSLKNASAANLFQITSANVYTSSIDHNISGKLILSGSTPQISDGTNNYTLPTNKGGIFAMTSDLATAGEWEEVITGTLQPIDSSINTIKINNAIEMFDGYTNPTKGFQILVNHTNNTFKITDKTASNDLLSFDNDIGIIEMGAGFDITRAGNFATQAFDRLVCEGDAIFRTSFGKNYCIKIPISNNSTANYEGIGFYQTMANAESGGTTGRLGFLECRHTTGDVETRALGTVVISSNNGQYYFQINNSGAWSSNATPTITSDDRLKFNEELITDATSTIMKLRPQIYDKQMMLGTEDLKEGDTHNLERKKESGLIVQEIYYEAPELRHLVITNSDNIQELPEGVDLEDIQNDIDYTQYGWNEKEPANLNYQGMIAYLIKMNQEQQTEINSLKEILARNNIV